VTDDVSEVDPVAADRLVWQPEDIVILTEPEEPAD
jgi:hypothetical protein